MAYSSKPRKVQCIETGEVFDSIHAAARAYQRQPGNLSRIIAHNLPNAWAGKHWRALSSTTHVEFLAIGNKGLVLTFDTIKKLADCLGVSRDTIKWHLHSGTPIQWYLIEKREITDY